MNRMNNNKRGLGNMVVQGLIFGLGFGIAAYGVNMLFGGNRIQTVKHIRSNKSNQENNLYKNSKNCDEIEAQLMSCRYYPNADCSILEKQLHECKKNRS